MKGLGLYIRLARQIPETSPPCQHWPDPITPLSAEHDDRLEPPTCHHRTKLNKPSRSSSRWGDSMAFYKRPKISVQRVDGYG
jgi:hypothetical protein